MSEKMKAPSDLGETQLDVELAKIAQRVWQTLDTSSAMIPEERDHMCAFAERRAIFEAGVAAGKKQ